MRSQTALTVRAVFLCLVFFLVVENFAPFCVLRSAFLLFCAVSLLLDRCLVVVSVCRFLVVSGVSLLLCVGCCMPFSCCFRRVLVAFCWLLHAVSLLFCLVSLLLRVKSLLFCVVSLLLRVKSLLLHADSLLLCVVSLLLRV